MQKNLHVQELQSEKFCFNYKKNCYLAKDSYKRSSVNAFGKDREYHSLVNSFTHIQSKAGSNNKEEGKLSKTTLLLVTRM